jgi:hypothetical protein
VGGYTLFVTNPLNAINATLRDTEPSATAVAISGVPCCPDLGMGSNQPFADCDFSHRMTG